MQAGAVIYAAEHASPIFRRDMEAARAEESGRRKTNPEFPVSAANRRVRARLILIIPSRNTEFIGYFGYSSAKNRIFPGNLLDV
jgi:hypothetical protein